MKKIKLKSEVNGVTLNTVQMKSIIGGVETQSGGQIDIYKCVCAEGSSAITFVQAIDSGGAVKKAAKEGCSGFDSSGITCTKYSNLSGVLYQ